MSEKRFAPFYYSKSYSGFKELQKTNREPAITHSIKTFILYNGASLATAPIFFTFHFSLFIFHLNSDLRGASTPINQNHEYRLYAESRILNVGTIINRPDLTVKASPPLRWGWRDGKCLPGIGPDLNNFDFLTPHKGAFKNQPDD